MIEFFVKLFIKAKTGLTNSGLDKILLWVSDAAKKDIAGAEKKNVVVSLIKQYFPNLSERSINLAIEFCLSLLSK